MTEYQNGWNENRKLILSSLDRVEHNIEDLESCTRDKLKDIEEKHNDFKEKTQIDLATLKTKASIVTAIISIAISLVVSVTSSLVTYSIAKNGDPVVEKNINTTIEDMVNEELKQKLKGESDVGVKISK